MRLIIAGGRDIYPTDFFIAKTINKLIMQPLNEDFDYIKCVLCGGASGVDEAGKKWANYRDIPVEIHEAAWDRYGRQAGPRRNHEMGLHADALLLIWDGESKGSRNMKKTMEAFGKPVYEEIVKGKLVGSINES